MRPALKWRAVFLAAVAAGCFPLILFETVFWGKSGIFLWLMGTANFALLIFVYFDIKARIDDGMAFSREQIEKALFKNFEQFESFSHLMRVLGDIPPLPKTRGWSVSPDCALILAQEVLKRKPDVVVEFGSGVSTLVIAHCLRQNGKGKLYSFDHSAEYLAKTKKSIQIHGLTELVELTHAALKPLPSDTTQIWYDYLKIKENCADRQISLVFVDGPPAVDGGTRAPVTDALRNQFQHGAIIILDDASRQHEQKVLKNWKNSLSAQVDFRDTEKGTAIVSIP